VKVRRVIGALSGAVVMIGLALAGGQPAQAAITNQPQPGVFSEVIPVYFHNSPQRCLDNIDGNNNAGNPQQVFHCHGYDSNGAPQRWQFVNLGLSNGAYAIQNMGSHLCLAVATAFGNPGTLITQETCTFSTAEQWLLRTPTTPDYMIGFFGLVNAAFPGECMATNDSSGNDHIKVVIATCNYDNAADPNHIRQVWALG
jgi:Ricin-type beta-trefoil lectin domain